MNIKLAREWYASREYLQKLQARANYLSMVEKAPLLRAKYTMDDWAVNPISFIETFGWTKITDMEGKIAPFFLWDYQKEIIFKLQEAEGDVEREHEILIDKPRKMGLTWVLVYYMLWRWLFKPQWSGFILSRTETEVDAGNADPDSSIFGKFRWAMQRLPPWLMPQGFRPKGGRGTSTDMNLRIINPAMETTLVGSSTNSNAGRSRRYSFSFVDECFFIEGFPSVYRAIQSVSRVKVFASTVRVGSTFKKLRDLCEANGDYVSLTWKQHPWNDDEWFKEMEKRAEVDPEVMKEIMVDYNVNIRQQYYPEVSQAKVMKIGYDSQKPTYVSMDFGSQDKTVLVWYQFDGNNINIIECFSNQRKTLDWYVPFLHPQAMQLGGQVGQWTLNESLYTERQLELIRKLMTWRKPVMYFGEAAHFQKNMPSNHSIADELVKYGVRLLMNGHAVRHEPRRTATSLLLPRMVFNDGSEGVIELYDAIGASRYNLAVKSVTSKDTLMKPVHDPEIADFRSALENFCVNYTRIVRIQRGDLTKDTKGRVDSLTSHLTKYLKI